MKDLFIMPEILMTGHGLVSRKDLIRPCEKHTGGRLRSLQKKKSKRHLSSWIRGRDQNLQQE